MRARVSTPQVRSQGVPVSPCCGPTGTAGSSLALFLLLADLGSASSITPAQRIALPAFPLRAPPGPPAPPGPVRAAAPPAEYHSDSAESLEEMPVLLAELGSSLTVADSSRSSLRTISAFPAPSPHPRTKRKASASRSNKSAGELVFELPSAHPPAVFVSRASGEPAVSRRDGLTAERRETGFL